MKYCYFAFSPSLKIVIGLGFSLVSIESSWWLIPWASYQIRKVAGYACAGNAGNVSPRRRLQRKPLVNDPGMHHGTCVTHVPWCMSGSLTRGGGETFPAFPAHAHPQFYLSGKRSIRPSVWHPGGMTCSYTNTITDLVTNWVDLWLD